MRSGAGSPPNRSTARLHCGHDVADDVRVTEGSAGTQSPKGPRDLGRFGLIGGIGPESTIAYYRLILEM